MTKFLSHLLAIFCSTLILSSCMNDDSNAPALDDSAMCDIVTFVGNPESNNYRSVFQFQKEGDSRTTTLRAKNTAINPSEHKVNSRLLLYYIPESGMHNVDDNVTVTNIYYVFNDSVHSGDVSKLPDWNSNPIFVYAIWRSGTYLNVQCGLTYAYEPSAFMLMVDETTINNEMPDLYLSYRKGNDRESNFKNFYASIDIAKIWNSSNCKGFTIHVNDSNIGNNKIVFKKTGLTPIQ